MESTEVKNEDMATVATIEAEIEAEVKHRVRMTKVGKTILENCKNYLMANKSIKDEDILALGLAGFLDQVYRSDAEQQQDDGGDLNDLS